MVRVRGSRSSLVKQVFTRLAVDIRLIALIAMPVLEYILTEF